MDMQDYAGGLEDGREMVFEDVDTAVNEVLDEGEVRRWEEPLREALERGLKETRRHHASEESDHTKGMVQGYAGARKRVLRILDSDRSTEEKLTAVMDHF